MSLDITLPLTDEQAQAVVVAADAFGVEPWEMAVYLLAATRWRVVRDADSETAYYEDRERRERET